MGSGSAAAVLWFFKIARPVAACCLPRRRDGMVAEYFRFSLSCPAYCGVGLLIGFVRELGEL